MLTFSRGPTILFDLDGTLVNSAPGILESIQYAMDRLGHPLSSDLDLKTLIGPPMQTLFEALLRPYDDNRVGDAITHYRAHFQEFGLFRAAAYRGIDSALEAMKSCGLSLMVATSKRQIFAEAMLRNTGLADHFSAIFGTPDDGSLDNKDNLLAELVRVTGVDPQITIMVGDRRDDMRAGIRNHIIPIGVLWGYGSKEELTAAGAVALCEEPTRLFMLIEGHAKTR